MTAAIVKVPFQGEEIHCATEGGTVKVSVRRLCDLLGIDRKSQQDRLNDPERCPWATGAMTTLVAPAEDGKARKQLFIDLDILPMFLATIDASRVAPAAKAKIVSFQRECTKALRDYFLKGYALNPGATPQQKADGHEAWRRWIADGVEDHEALWVGRVVEELARLWRQPAKVDQAGGFPVGLIAAVKRCYHSVVGGAFYQALRDKTGSGDERDKRYRGLTREGYDLLSRELICIERIARTCRTKEEFIDKMNHVYGGEPMQTGFW